MSLLRILREDGEENIFECDNCGNVDRKFGTYVAEIAPTPPWRIFKLGDGTYYLCSEECYVEFRTGT